jgi:hypothetical protein
MKIFNFLKITLFAQQKDVFSDVMTQDAEPAAAV